jgi:hypothetical protein
MSNGPPILMGLNNGILTGTRVMPAKDGVSDGNSLFSLSRRSFMRVMPLTTETNTVQQEKKWFGNKDASQVTANARVSQVGIGTLGSTQAFKSSTETNSVRQALNRVRGGGRAVTPMKKTLSTQIL